MRRLFASLALIASLITGAFLVHATPVLAQVDTGLSEVGQTVNLNSGDPRVIAANIINIALGLVGIVLVGLLVYAGFVWMTAGGDATKVDKAKKIILSSIIGLIIVLSSWAIARFVIERLLSATQGDGGGGTNQGGGGNGGGFGGGGSSNAFQVKSITPQGTVRIRNIQVKIVFSRPVDDRTASGIVITKNGGAGVAGTITVNNSVVTFVPQAACPSPNENLFCFDADSDYTVQVGGSLRSTQGQSIVCGGFAPACTATFRTGNLIDTQDPTVSVVDPLDGQGVPADSLVLVRARATDDSGVAYIEFTDAGNLIDQAGPAASSTPLDFTGEVQWDTAGIPLQSVRELRAHAYDIDAHDIQSSAVSVIVRAPSCFNGVRDGDESDIDCGGTPNTPGYCGACSGGSCSANNQCSSGVCQSGSCVVQPTITAVSPQDGRAGTFVTLQGVNFGAAGTVRFLGGAGDADDVVATAPIACTQAGTQTWSPTQVIIAVPDAAANGPIQLTNGSSGLSDVTNDGRGVSLPDFLVNDVSHPGMCGLNPTQGVVGDQFTAVGQGFGSSPSSMMFGTTSITSFAGWADGQAVTNVPIVGTGRYAVRVKVGSEESNPALYTVMNRTSSGPPVITTIDPPTGPRGEYVTLTGTNFGFSVGTVRFKNKLSGQEALGDTAFPAACSEGFWKETNVVVKVPASFLAQGAITPGDYAVRIIRSDAVESNEVDFVVSTGAARPGICAISPTVGPVGTTVTISGERFGGTSDSLTFQSGISAVADSWSSTDIKSKVPTGAVTGPVQVSTQGQTSNAVNFQVRNCNEQAGICSQNEQCCGNGSCISRTQTCAAVVQSAMFAWQSSTGLIPVAPRVIEECRPDLPQAPLPSPAPWNKRAGGEQACVTATVTMRFSTKLDPTSATASNFRIKKCTSSSNEPCATTDAVTLRGGFPILQPATQSQDAILLEGSADFEPNTTYLVEVLTGVKALGAGGANIPQSATCGDGVGYCFRFKTRTSTEPCAVGGVSVSPHPYELNDSGAEVSYLASPLSSDDKCVVLQCDKYDWDWQNGDEGNPDGRAIFRQPLQAGTLPNSVSCRQTGVAVSETGNVPVRMNAIVKPDNIKGTADLFVKFIPPRVMDYAPKCDTACVNALLWAKFNVELDPMSLAGNVEVRACANENCIESELGAPLPLTTDPNQLTTVPRTSETTKRFLQIRAVDANGTNLLLPATYYRVLLKGGSDSGIRGLNGVPMTGLNHPDGFVWTFRTKLGTEAFCTAETVDVSPGEKYETVVGARQIFKATPFGAPDECSADGQMLIQTNDAAWSTSNASIADYIGQGTIDTGGVLPAQCNSMCLAMGSQGVFGKVAACGNGIIETTDAAYCQTYNARYGGSNCIVLPAGARDAEQCDPNAPGNTGLCDASSCLWKPVAQVGQAQGTCGNGALDNGEMCDFGSFCMGGNTIADMTSCTASGDRAACVADGGTCAPRLNRGCSAFCRHAGSAAGGSTCGNGDIADGEDCDDGNNGSNDGCSSMCLHTGSRASVTSVCGNAILESGETCEKNQVNDPEFPAGCNANSCLHTGTGLCDNDPNTPNVNCCSNGTIERGEDCDDGNKDAGDGCGLTCTLEGSSASYADPSFCSDGILQIGEQCEVGLPSSDAALRTAPNNAAPGTLPIGAPAGDGIIDAIQLATIIGDADPDANGLMAATLSALLLGKTGEATYGLQCGFTSEASCPAGYGLTDAGCCNARPEIETAYPLHGSSNVCRNVQIKAVFNAAMDAGSVTGNFQVARLEAGQNCPAGTTQVTDNFEPIKKGPIAWVGRLVNRFIAWVSGQPAYAAIWCAGSASGRLVAVEGDATAFTFDLTNALEANTTYRLKFLGDNSNPNNPLSDNDFIANKKGIKTSKGVVAPYDGAAEAGPLTWSFTTGPDICKVNTVLVTDRSTAHPLLFVKNQERHTFRADVLSLQNGTPVTIDPVAEYEWTWDPWTTSDNTVVQVVAPNPGNTDTRPIIAQNKNGNAFVVAWLVITNDTISTPPTTGRSVQGSAPVTVQLCENPWPSLSGPGPLAPFRDKEPTGNGNDSSLTGTAFENGPFYNFSTTYCRDAGEFGVSDDLPALEINAVPPTSVDASEGILRQYLFTYGAANPELQKDGVGIRVAGNPLHLSPEDWYAWRGFGGSPESIMVDGYRALRDGNTTYIAAANLQDPGENIYSNIYLISHNPDAAPVTVGIYDQMVQSLAFNINLSTEVSNVCVRGNDPNVYGQRPFLVDGAPVACSNDFECGKVSPNAHCASFKLKIARDTVRLADFQQMSRTIESYKNANGTYPKLEGGTFLQGFSTTRWGSWTDELSKVLSTKLPLDPVNEFLSCGLCSGSQTMCGDASDCPADQTCGARTVAGATYDPIACWDAMKRQYLCPTQGVSPSRVYQYRAIDDGARYELSAEFEVPKPSGMFARWWSPTLVTEVKRCANPDSLGLLCENDADCRSCPNPRDAASCPTAQFPVTNGACRTSNGRFLYSNVCSNVPYGQGGTCGDGVLGSVCAAGANAGRGCTTNADCPGSSCTGREVCEVGQTRTADCKTDPSLPSNNGLKVQVCSECKGFVDDAALSVCNVGVQCGNGRVDQKCTGGTRNNMACLQDSDCPATPGSFIAPSCGPTSEVCDDGSLNGTYGHCNLQCNGYASYCGDGMISPGETCDKGAQNGNYCSGNCSNTCGLDCRTKAPYCGDGMVTAPNEQCDGQTVTTVLGICTAGNIDQPCSTNAECGQGGICASNGALASCQGVTINKCATSLKLCLGASTVYQGSSFNPANRTVCQTNSDCTGNTVCRSVSEAVVNCTADSQCSLPGIGGSCSSYPTVHVRACSASGANKCTYPEINGMNSTWTACKVLNFCGDGIIDAPGEECDDATNNGDTKACTSACKKNVCGDGKPYVNVEECDNGAQNGSISCNADYGSTCASCSTQCRFLSTSGGYCGDQVKNGGEQCDGSAVATNITNQFSTTPASGRPSLMLPYLNADCMQTPCKKTVETGVSCKSLGYDFATNGVKPKLKLLLEPSETDLDSTITTSECPEVNGMKGYEWAIYQKCLGAVCLPSAQQARNTEPNASFVPGTVRYQNAQLDLDVGDGPMPITRFHLATPKPSTNDFWACVEREGPAMGVGIESSDSPELLQCGLSCGFTGCARCSDEVGTGVIEANVFDAVYNQVVPFAKVSLMYRGVVVSQTATDENGHFQLTALNARAECSQYKLVIDKYDDNPCTGNEPGRPACGGGIAPAWTYTYQVRENERGGYWPLTTQSFSVTNFRDVVGNQGSDQIFIFPRPAAGEAYFTVLWDEAWTSNGDSLWGGYANHLVLPKEGAFTVKPTQAEVTTCDYDNRPAANAQCARDITWKGGLKGYQDVSQLPYANLICLHKAGDIVGGYTGGSDNPENGCPVEGTAACQARGGANCKANCNKTYWDTCDFITDGPLTTYFRYTAFAGSQENLLMYWGDWEKSVHNVVNGSSAHLSNLLSDKKYHAVISTNSQLVELKGPDASQSCDGSAGNCKFWKLGEINPNDGSIRVSNQLKSGAHAPNIAVHSFHFQGNGQNDNYCRNGDTLYKKCSDNSDCAGLPSGTSCTTATATQWSRANY